MQTKFRDYYITIDSNYILISKIPLCEFETASDIEVERLLEEDIVTGYDRCDGEDYYRDYPDKQVVDHITNQILLFGIFATDIQGNRLK